jgi:hypothetical protein
LSYRIQAPTAFKQFKPWELSSLLAHVAHFEKSVVSGLMWYVQVSILHSGHLPGHITLECVKAHHPLTPFIYSEAVQLFNIFYRIKNSSDFVIVDCAVYPQLNGFKGHINSFKKLDGQFAVSVNTSEYSSPSCPSFVLMQLYPQYLEPLHKVTKFGISGSQRKEEIVSVPNLICESVPTTQHIMIKFHWELFEQMRKRFIRPEMTSNDVSSKALLVKLARFDKQVLADNQQDIVDKLEFTA